MNTRCFKNIKSLCYFFISLHTQFSTYTIFWTFSHTKNKDQIISTHHQTLMFPLKHLDVSHQILLSLEEPSTKKYFMNYFSQILMNLSNNFNSLVSFLRINWNVILTLLVFWLFKALQLFMHGTLTGTRESSFVLLRKMTL